MQQFGLVLILFTIFYVSKSARILGAFPKLGQSHHILGYTLMKELALRGHNVTYIDSTPESETVENLRYISVEEVKYRLIDYRGNNSIMLDLSEHTIYEQIKYVSDVEVFLSEETFKLKQIQILLNDPRETFDVVIIENMFYEAFIGLGHHFKCPVIMLAPGPVTVFNDYFFANPSFSSYIPNIISGLSPNMDFWQRMKNFYYNSIIKYFIHFDIIPRQNEVMQKYLPNSPNLKEQIYNISLMLLASHVSFCAPMPLVPAIKEIGGYHIQKTKPLPKEIKNFLDDSKEGVIVFSLGSLIKSKDLSSDKLKAILNAFGKIKQKILWKYEEDLLEKPSNVKIMSWLPQSDTLAHPNVIAFINHGGLVSTTESVYHGKPMIGLPVMWDQEYNSKTAEEGGYGIAIPYRDLTEDKLTQALIDIVSNKKYKKNAMLRSQIMRGDPISQMDLAVHWIEHVIQHQGALHLRSTGLNLFWYQKFMLDVIALIVIGLFILYILIKRTFYRPMIVNRTKKNL